jgi:hypothetical protein
VSEDVCQQREWERNRKTDKPRERERVGGIVRVSPASKVWQTELYSDFMQ